MKASIWPATEYTIADMICYPWTVNWKAQGQDIEEFKYFKRWFEELGARPGVQRGMAVGAEPVERSIELAAGGTGSSREDALQPARPSGACRLIANASQAT